MLKERWLQPQQNAYGWAKETTSKQTLSEKLQQTRKAGPE
jgi:hypothetical protein